MSVHFLPFFFLFGSCLNFLFSISFFSNKWLAVIGVNCFVNWRGRRNLGLPVILEKRLSRFDIVSVTSLSGRLSSNHQKSSTWPSISRSKLDYAK